MCKIWSIKYGCDHIFTFRLSTCRGSVTAQAKSGDTPTTLLCHPSPALSFCNKSQSCGPCQRRPEEESLAQWMDAVKEDGDENIYEVQAGYNKQLYQLNRRLPDGQKKKTTRPPQQMTTHHTKRGSLLKFEVKPEDIPEDEYAEYYRQWALPSSTFTEDQSRSEEGSQSDFGLGLEHDQGFADSGSDFDSTAWSDQNDMAEQQTCKTSPDCSAQIRLAEEQSCWMTAWPSVGAW
ncbi:hypothetical protein KC345_g5118 [Hortaea werneckii]|nr:hypothetical protein KC345_g5118 [Hortaea werneckii]